MSVQTREKREQRANIWEQMKEVLDIATKEGRSLTAEERAKYETQEKDLDRLAGEIEFEEKAEARTKEMATPDYSNVIKPEKDADEERAQTSKAYANAFNAWMRSAGGVAELAPEQRSILRTGFVPGTELRAEGVSPTSAGGYFVPQGFRQTITETLKWYGGMRQVSEIITTDSGQDLPWPTNDDTANVGAILAENTQVTEQDVTLGQKTLKANMYTSKLTRVSLQLLNDSAFDIESFLARKLAQRIGRIQNTHFTTGTGTSQPEGIQTNSVVGVTGATGETLTVIYDDLVGLIYSVDPAYRATAGGFMMHDTTIGVIRKLKDTQSRPLWEVGVQLGQPDKLLGYPVTANNDMPVPAANAKSILFGDFKQAYVIRDVAGFQLLRLDERYADFLQVGFLGFARADGIPQDFGAYRAFKHSAT